MIEPKVGLERGGKRFCFSYRIGPIHKRVFKVGTLKLLKSFLVCSCLVLAACNAAEVKPNLVGGENSVEGATEEKSQAPLASEKKVTKPGNTSPEKPRDQLEILGNRMTAVQDHLLQIKSQSGQLQQQNQALSLQLQSLQSEVQALASMGESTSVQEAPQPDSFNGVLDQITMMANELSSQVQDGAYRVVSAYTSKGQWVLIRFHRFTGETWLADKGQWNQLTESGATGTAEYEVVLLRADKDIKGYVAARINRISGESWWLKQNIWQPYLQ